MTHLQARVYHQLRLLILFLLAVMVLALVMATKAYACDPGQYYDPSHQICQGTPPAYPPRGYGPPQTNHPFPPGYGSHYPGGY